MQYITTFVSGASSATSLRDGVKKASDDDIRNDIDSLIYFGKFLTGMVEMVKALPIISGPLSGAEFTSAAVKAIEDINESGTIHADTARQLATGLLGMGAVAATFTGPVGCAIAIGCCVISTTLTVYGWYEEKEQESLLDAIEAKFSEEGWYFEKSVKDVFEGYNYKYETKEA
ncbi:MAG: hypothetical protein LBJ59_06965 [Zoogloeaceae bacterium]|nr:hypothetical protein [Zoogloeaceae bacterium]